MKALQSIRERRGMTYEDVARKAHISAGTVRDIERGTIVARPRDLKQIAEAIGFTRNPSSLARQAELSITNGYYVKRV